MNENSFSHYFTCQYVARMTRLAHPSVEIAIEPFPEFGRFPKMMCFGDFRLPVCISASASQIHAEIAETDVIDNCEPVIGGRLAVRSEKIVRRSHEQRAILVRVFLITSPGGMRIFFREAVESFDERLQPG